MKTYTSFACLALAAAILAGCFEGPSQIGAVIGSPTGVSYATTLENDYTIVLQGGISFFSGGLPVTCDVILWSGSAHRAISTGWDWYVGAGGRMMFFPDSDNDSQFGVRMPLGLTYNLAPANSGLVILEIAPGMDFAGSGFTFDGCAGVRWPF